MGFEILEALTGMLISSQAPAPNFRVCRGFHLATLFLFRIPPKNI